MFNKVFNGILGLALICFSVFAYSNEIHEINLNASEPGPNDINNPIVINTAVTDVIDIEYISALFVSWNPWSNVSNCDVNGANCDNGWIDAFRIEYEDGTTEHFGGWDAYETDQLALAAASDIPGLTGHTSYSFYIQDGFYTDNDGGLSLNVSVIKLDQAITSFTSSPGTGMVGGSSTLSATGGDSGNPVTFSSSTSSVCTVSGSTVSFIAAGTCTVTADQAGNDSYNPAPQESLNITIAKADQAITSFTSSPGTGMVGGSSTLSATGGDSGNPVSYSSSTSSVCSVSGSTVSFIAAGTCTVTADQAGNDNYNPAPQQSLNIPIAKLDQVITDFISDPDTGMLGGTSTLSATGGDSGNPVSYSSSTSSVCTVSDSTVSFIAAGTCTVTADQAGNDNYNPAPQQSLDITVTNDEAKPIPTLSFWGLLLLSALISTFGINARNRKKG